MRLFSLFPAPTTPQPFGADPKLYESRFVAFLNSFSASHAQQ
jgi:hypothetical protein